MACLYLERKDAFVIIAKKKYRVRSIIIVALCRDFEINFTITIYCDDGHWLAHTGTKLLVWSSATLVGWHRVRWRYENDWVLTYTRIRSFVRSFNMTKARVSWFVLCSIEFIFIYCFLFFPFALLFLSKFLQHLLCRRHLLREENKGIAFQAKKHM